MAGDKRFSICRLCLSSNGNLINVFEGKAIHGHALADVITELLRHEVSSEDIYPQCVCTNCVGKLRDFKSFKDQCTTYKKLLERAYATRKIFSKEVNTKGISTRKESDWKEDNTNAVETITPDILSLKPKVEKSVDVLPIGKRSALLPRGNSSRVSVKEPYSWENLTVKEEEQTSQVEAFLEPLSTSEPSAVFIKEGSPGPSAKEPNSWENLAIKQERETYEDGIEDPLACGDSGDETFPCASEQEADAEVTAVHFCKSEYTAKEECQDSANSQDASGSVEKEGEVKRQIFRCSDCGKEYICPNAYRRHLDMHKFGETFKCVHCDKHFVDKRALSRHKVCHSDVKLGCDTCGKTLKNKQLLKRHLLLHGDRNFKCRVCEKGFYTKSHLTEHENRHKKGNSHVCDVCGKFFDNTFVFKRHKYGHKYLKSKPRRHECSICGMKCCYPSELVIHMRKHTKEQPFSCPKCEACFTMKCSLQSHIKTQHTEAGLTRVQCPECGQQYAKAANLKRHMKINHMSLKEFKCQDCGQEFAHKNTLKTHVKREHS